ncbi:MAG: beta-lactamase family protein [Prolixibacteraceae bacterium]|nr:beta-lactamase family protein [Prolixibacteraceae bacterium]
MNTGYLLIDSPTLDIHWKTAIKNNSTNDINPDQPYHFASIGKTVTSMVISILYEKGLIDFNDKISEYLDSGIINGLHHFKGVDYSGEIRIRHLLNHSSGIADYYIDKNSSGINGIQFMMADTGHFWTPIETIEWTKNNLKPKFKPGKGMHYSDTNYQLLGLIIERITGMPLHEAYKEYIFKPLMMNDTYMIFYSEPMSGRNIPMVDFYYKGINLSNAKSISMSWASGGIVSTSEDMLTFMKAVIGNKIVTKETYQKMKDFAKMGPGINYGYGLMNFKFMFMPEKYEIIGNSGSTGAFMYYNEYTDTYFIGSFHKMGYQVQPIIFIMNAIKKINGLQKITN